MRYFYAKAKGNGNLIDLKQGDCLELMKDIPDKSVDMILCDLPYGVTSRNKWDSIIPFEPLWESYHRVIKDNGAIVLNCQQPFTTYLISSNIKEFKYCWVWYKKQCSGFLNSKKQPLRNCEDIAVFYKKQPTYNPQMEIGKPYIKKAVTNGDGKNYGKFDRVGEVAVNEGTRFPRSVIKISNDNHKSLHPTQKPIELLEWLIYTYTNENETVLDNCMGSGSTGIACINTNRNFIGIELDNTYFEIAKKRIEEVNSKSKT